MMSSFRKKCAILVVAAMVVSGCTSDQIRTTAIVLGAIAAVVVTASIISKLSEKEKEDYESTVQKNLKEQNGESEATTTWQNEDGSKKIDLVTSKDISPYEIATQDGKYKKVDKTLLARIPQDSVCREATSKFSTGRNLIEETGIYCRTAEGDYVRVDGVGA